MLRFLIAILISTTILLSLTQPATAQRSSAEKAVTSVASTYFEAWYAGDGDQMEEIVHPMLAKRGPLVRESKEIELSDMSALKLIQATESGGGSSAPDSLVSKTISVLSINSNIASVKVDSKLLTEYLQLVKWKGEWKIINVLWEIKPKWRAKWNYS
ncbi:MAG: nuclear transport factor 2 family protein [Fodinibius sp.]|nr:nuclear transport factor 2 family protein [Fodinibius sp.]